jgi:Leucine-rich repeat (LRR) protein
MTWYIITGFLLSLFVVLYLHNRKPNVVKIFQATYTDTYYETNSVKVSLIRGVNSITHIQPFNQLNQQDINNLAIEYIKLPEPARALTLMLEYSSRFDSIDLLKHSQE